MKNPVVYTGREDLRVTRRRRVYPGFVPKDAVLQKTESERTSQIFLRDDELTRGPLIPEHNTESITFQSDPALRIKLAKLRQAKKEVQTEIKVIRQKISKHEYARVVTRYTTMTRGWVAVRPPRYEIKPSPAQYSWVRQYRVTELLSKEEWLERMLKLTTLRVQQRKDYERQLAEWHAHPEWKRERTIYWHSDPYWLRTVVVPEGALGTTRTPVKEFKLYPRRRWDLIRLSWSRRLNSLRPRIDKLQRRFDRIKADLANLYAFTEYKPMVYSQDCEQTSLDSHPADITLKLHGMPRQHSAEEDPIALPGGFWPTGHSASGGSHLSYYSIESISSREDRTARPAISFSATERDFCWLSPSAYHTVVGDRWTYDHYWNQRQIEDSVSKEAKHRVITLDTVSHLEDDLEDRLRSARLALLNLRLGRDVLEFNPFRSLLEQKDIPSTVRSGRDFLRFARNAPGLDYYEVTTSSGAKTLLTTGVMSDAQRRVLLGMRRPSESALRAVGLKRAVRRIATKRTSLATLAGMYLAYKFAIAPTRSDIETTLEKGWDYVMTCRRGLDQLIRRKGLHFWEHRSLYRTFRVGDIDMLNQHSHKRLVDVTIPIHHTRSWSWKLSIPSTDWTHWLRGERPETVKPIKTGFVYESSGDINFWFPAVYSEQELTPDYIREIDLHNLDQLWSLIPDEFQGSLTYVRQILRGKVFAKFSAKDLLKGLGDGSIRSKIAWANLYKTTWDLLPCSFVLEWFTNLGEVATATNDLANAMISGLNVSKKTWASLSSSVFANAPVFPELDISVTAQATKFTRIWKMSDPGTGSRSDVFDVLSEASGSIRLNVDLPPQARILRNTAIRTSVRRVVDEALDTPSVRLRISITPPQAGSLAAMLLSGG